MNVLVFAPHPDDEILGVGGTIAKRVSQGHKVYVCVITKGYEPLFPAEIMEKGREECKKADALIGVCETIFLDFPAAMLESVPRYELNAKVLEVVERIKPDEVYIPHRGDMQIDHKLTVDAAMVAMRPKYEHRVKRIFAYETPSETGWDIPNTVNEFIPNVYEDISMTFDKKIEALNIFKSQMGEYPDARSAGAVEAMAKYRGSMVRLAKAEAFMLIRMITL